MVRTVISLTEDDKAWLDRAAQEQGVPMTELVRRAVHMLRQRSEQSLADVLRDTRGIWPGADGLEWQERLRGEW